MPVRRLFHAGPSSFPSVGVRALILHIELPALLVTPVAYSLLAEAEERGFRGVLLPYLSRASAGLRAVSFRSG